jgi:hypothetical protein
VQLQWSLLERSVRRFLGEKLPLLIVGGAPDVDLGHTDFPVPSHAGSAWRLKHHGIGLLVGSYDSVS